MFRYYLRNKKQVLKKFVLRPEVHVQNSEFRSGCVHFPTNAAWSLSASEPGRDHMAMQLRRLQQDLKREREDARLTRRSRGVLFGNPYGLQGLHILEAPHLEKNTCGFGAAWVA